jgi:hypothetical protein
MAAESVEKRLADLEPDFARLKAELAGTKEPWWKQIWGSFANDPAFLEAMRYGREYRESLRPKPRKKRKS